MGLVDTSTNARHTVTTYSYDANHNLTGVSYSDGTPNVGYTYDAYDRLATMTDGIGAWAFGYDANSQLTSVDGPWDHDTISYAPDDLGRIVQMIPQGGTTVSYGYDSLNRLTHVQRGLERFTYTYNGVNPLVQQLTRPNGSVTEYQYNALSQLTKILNHTSTGDVLSQHTFTYNAQDLRANEIFDGSAIPPAPAVPDTNTTYTTNDVNQLLSTVNPDEFFAYDDDGNMMQGYTKDGYVFTAEYDAENRMTSLEYTDNAGVLHRQEFRYSGDDLLAEQLLYENSVLVDTVRIVRDGMLAIQDRNASNIVMREYTWGLNLGGGIGGLLNLNSTGQNYAYLYDGKGNVEAVLDNMESVVAAYRYDPFGILLNQTGSLNQPYGFSTKRYNAPVGMVQYEYRNYLPEWGRWTTRDPLGETGGMNLYAFVGNNPVNWVDPWGEHMAPINTGAMVQSNQEIQSAMDFLPQFLLDMLYPTTPEGLASDLSSEIMGLACPLDVSGGGNWVSPEEYADWVIGKVKQETRDALRGAAGKGKQMGQHGKWQLEAGKTLKKLAKEMEGTKFDGIVDKIRKAGESLINRAKGTSHFVQ